MNVNDMPFATLMNPLRICHINFAKGYRGGERQTENLIKILAQFGLYQKLLVRHDSPLLDNLSHTPNLELIRARKPYISRIPASRGADLLHAHETLAAQFAFACSLFTRSPYIITRRVPHIPGSNFYTNGCYTKSLMTVALSHAIKRNLLDYNPEIKVTVIPSMVSDLPTNKENIHLLKQTYNDKFIIGHIGALVNEHKGQSDLIAAARILQDTCPDIHFLLLGSGRDADFFRNQSAGLTNIELLGFKNNVGDYLAIFDLFVFPSLQEGLGSILLDAMQFGLPVVATEVDGIPDIIIHEKNGLLVPPRDPHSLAGSIRYLYENPDIRNLMSKEGELQSQNYSPEVIGRKYVELYRQLLHNRNIAESSIHS